jgi:hypothetical protein
MFDKFSITDSFIAVHVEVHKQPRDVGDVAPDVTLQVPETAPDVGVVTPHKKAYMELAVVDVGM